jgi:formylglycine-generating enzyme required for sulfatase activity
VDWTKKGYRLPTEAEWEFACRGDYPEKAAETATKPFGVGTGAQMKYDLANFYTYYPYDTAMRGEYSNGLGIRYIGQTSVVGSYSANNYGLFDMHGNVWEWCWDWHGTYPKGGLTDYRGPDSGASRIVRGGSWYSYSRSLRSAHRVGNNPDGRDSDIGFRLVRNISNKV